jgi:type IV secretion system protein VirB9
MIRLLFLLASACLLPAAVAGAQDAGLSVSQVDSRIRYVDYDANAIVRITGYTGYQIMVEFEPGERIETVGIGDSSGWQVTPNGAATVMFLKPVGLPRTTNMSIVTNQRTYNLELIARSGVKVAQRELVYALRFRYPQKPQEVAAIQSPVPVTATPPEQWNRSYSYDGSKGNVPEQVFDDGKSTFFRFIPGTSTPAIFSMMPGTGESIVNFSVRGPYVVVEQVGPQFVLRQGSDVTYIFNDAYVVPAPGFEAPKAREKRKRGLFGRKSKGQSEGKGS